MAYLQQSQAAKASLACGLSALSELARLVFATYSRKKSQTMVRGDLMTGSASIDVKKGSQKGSQESQEAAPPWRALWVLALGLAMIVLDSSIVNVSIPSIIAAIHINLAQAQWVTALYSIVLAALLLLPVGWGT